MKRVILMLFFLLPLFLFGQRAKIEFETTMHNFGNISESGGMVSYDFVFKNTGNSPLILTEVRPSCGCATPQWSRKPILPNETGSIKVSFNPKNRPNSFLKSITVKSNAENAIVSLTIKGKVFSGAADPYADYTHSIGSLKTRSHYLNLGSIYNTATVEKTMDIVNTGPRPVKVSIQPAGNYILASVTPETLKSGEKGEIHITYYAAQRKDWGFVNDQMELQTDTGDKGSLGVVANICEDFSEYKNNLYQNAPQAVFSETDINLGILKKNTTKKQEIYIQNAGKSELIIRKIKTSDDQMLTVVPAKTIIKPGKKIKVTLTLNTDDIAGRKVKIVSFTLNDPKNTIVTCKLTGNVQ